MNWQPIIRLARLGLWLVVITGIFMHAYLRDTNDSLVVVFYAMPLPLLLGATLLLALNRRHRAAALIVALGIASTWVWKSFRWHEPQPSTADEVRVLFWNLNRPETPRPQLIGMIQKMQPDFVACVEPGPHAERDTTAYMAALPGYDCQFMPRGILWLSRHPSRYRARGKIDNIGAYAIFESQLKEKTLRFVVADVYAEPTRPRTAQLKEVLEFSNHDPRTIIMGDFNTPSESWLFDAYRNEPLQDAVETGGKGFRETWFWGLPLLSLDHVWLGRDWQVLEAHKIWTTASDHAAIFVRIH